MIIFDCFAKTLSQLLLDEEFLFWGIKDDDPPDDALVVPLAKGLGAMFYLAIIVDIDNLSRERYDIVFETYSNQIPLLLESDFERVIFLTLFVTHDENFSITSPEFVVGQSFYNVQWIVNLSNSKIIIPNNAPANILKMRNITEKALSVCNSDNSTLSELSFKDMAKNVLETKYSVSHKPIATYTILLVNLLIWGCMELFGSSTDYNTLLAFGANTHPLNPEWSFYRLFSSMFLHIGIVHLVYNSFSLYIFGVRLEKFFGSFVFLFIYVLSGLSASFFSMFFSDAISAGASGAILGLAGALIILGKKHKMTFQGLNTYTIVTLSISVIALGFLDSEVNNLGHIIGFAAGTLVAYIYNSLNLYWNKQKEIKENNL